MKINPASSFANFIAKNKSAQGIFKFANKNPSLTNSFVATASAWTIRPIGINTMPGKKDDKKYFTVRSLITGALDLATSAIYYIPINKLADRLEKTLLKQKNTVYYKNKLATQSIKTLINRGSYFIALPFQSALMFWAIPKVVNKLFTKDKKDVKITNRKFLELTGGKKQ